MKRCCKYHDKFNYRDTDLELCGMAGMGAVVVCCKDCPKLEWYKENQPTRPIEYYTDDVKNGLTYDLANPTESDD